MHAEMQVGFHEKYHFFLSGNTIVKGAHRFEYSFLIQNSLPNCGIVSFY